MEPGKCYGLNPDRGTQYGWISNDAQDRWWWVEKPCGGEDEDDEEVEWELVQCSGSGFLGKKSFAGNSETADENGYFSSVIWGKDTKLFFDAMGRKTGAHPETRRYLFVPNIDRSSKFGSSESSLFRMVLSDGRICGVEGADYGIVVDGRLKGGNYCYDLDVKGHYRRKVLSRNLDYFCGENSNLINFTFEYKYTPILTEEVHYVKTGYVFPDGHLTTKQDEDYFRRHEQRHQSDTRKITRTGDVVFIDRAVCENDYCAWAEEMAELLRIEKINFYKAKIDSASDYYHDQCYNHGKCE
jgi:hypothetical protein